MQLLLWMLCSMTLLFSGGVSSYKLSEKLIASSSKSESFANEELLKLKVYFIEKPTTRLLQEKYDLRIEMEKLDNYYMAVIKPIPSLKVRNDLLLALSPMFQDIFFINYQEEIQETQETPIMTKPVISSVKEKKETSFINEIGLKWVALLSLSAVGLILSILSRRKIIKLGKRQKDLKLKQKKIEIEIKKLGAEDA